ncbi:hypothetical protein K432DRAFT_385028 [Lepidopterella palustris CBS 459.81]|uniref:Uncharacterized protein n=1 Tax=Lepidopterella palustris CBS 459.81 TaxID=1314670 RepID=A0A8E2E409_9PEZI|nr:hypothetical protein K432DRAFT_385028 [Lepidopterella palustris CBS 459.81]
MGPGRLYPKTHPSTPTPTPTPTSTSTSTSTPKILPSYASLSPFPHLLSSNIQFYLPRQPFPKHTFPTPSLRTVRRAA